MSSLYVCPLRSMGWSTFLHFATKNRKQGCACMFVVTRESKTNQAKCSDTLWSHHQFSSDAKCHGNIKSLKAVPVLHREWAKVVPAELCRPQAEADGLRSIHGGRSMLEAFLQQMQIYMLNADGMDVLSVRAQPARLQVVAAYCSTVQQLEHVKAYSLTIIMFDSPWPVHVYWSQLVTTIAWTKCVMASPHTVPVPQHIIWDRCSLLGKPGVAALGACEPHTGCELV